MKHLILAVLCSVAISVLLRLSEKRAEHRMVLFTSNYIVDVLLSLFFLLLENRLSIEVSHIDVGFGIVSGIMYLVSFVLLQYNIEKNGVVLAATFMKLGVLIPIIFSIFVFGELPGTYQKIGFVIALIAILFIYVEKQEQRSNAKMWLAFLLIAGGFTDVWAKVSEELGQESHMNVYLLCTFTAATFVSLGCAVIKRERPSWNDIAWGAAVGVPNYLATRFLLLALQEIDAIIVFPVYNVGTIFIVGMVGVFFFKEQLTKQKWLGYILVIVAILLLNV